MLDHASRSFSYGSKLVIDGTKKHAEEGGAFAWEPGRAWRRDELPVHDEILDQAIGDDGIWFVTTRKQRADQGRHLGEWAAATKPAADVRMIAVLDDTCDPADFEECIWTLLNNIDPERDVRVVDGPTGVPVWVVDATPKRADEGFVRAWPDKIVMDEAVEKDVLARLGPAVGLEGSKGTS